ncbi:MAG: GumC family protein [Sphingobacteriaceae bacterium]
MNKDIIYKYLQYWYLFLGFTFALFLGAFLYLRYATPEYTISSSILIKDDDQGTLLEGSAFDKNSRVEEPKNIDDEVEFFKSNGLMQRVMEDLSMQTSYYTEGRFKATQIYGDKVPIYIIVNNINYEKLNVPKEVNLRFIDDKKFNLIDSNKSIIYSFGQTVKMKNIVFSVFMKKNTPLPAYPINVKFNNLPKLAKSYVNLRMDIQPISKTSNVLSIELTEPVPKRGIDIVNKLIEIYNLEGIEYRNKKASNTLQFIGSRLKSLTTELSGVEKNVEQYKQQNRVTDVTSNAQSYVQNAEVYNKQLSESELQINILNSIEKYLSNPASQNELVPSTLGISDPTLSNLIERLSNLQLERQQQLRTAQPGNPIIISLDEQILSLKANIRENLKNIKNTLVISRNNLKSSSSKFESKIQAVPSIERDLLQIKRQQGIKESLYLYLLQKREESALSLASTVSNARIIDQAVASDFPVKPKKPFIFLVAFILGIGLPFSFIYLKDLFDNKIQNIAEVKNLSSVNILGEISHNTSNDTIVVKKGSTNVISELFRLIRTNLKFSGTTDEKRVFLVTSCNSGEGKTFFSINLGISLALTNKRVVILEFDLRKPELLKAINLNNELGLSNYLNADTMHIDEIITSSMVDPNLFVIGAGPIPSNPSEILVELKLERLISDLKARFDYIIIDSSPIGKVADAYSLASFADSNIFVVRYNYTLKSQLDIINDIADNKMFKNPMLVLNDAKKGNSVGYAYGYKGAV